MLSRTQITSTIRAAVEPLDYVHAMWEGGAAAFDRVDEWSDIDLQLDVDDAHILDAVRVVEQTLATLSSVELRYEIPQPTWHGHWQAFYKLTDASPFLMLDFAVVKHSNPNKFLEPAIHGTAKVHFDKSNIIATFGKPLDPAAEAQRKRDRLETLKVTFPLYQPLTLKELHRHNDVEALLFYHAFTLRPLVEVLRFVHCPARNGFHGRYFYYDFPADIAKRLEPFFFVTNADDLRTKREAAEQWFYETVRTLEKN